MRRWLPVLLSAAVLVAVAGTAALAGEPPAKGNEGPMPRPLVIRFLHIPAVSFMESLKRLGHGNALGEGLDKIPIALNEPANAVVVIGPPELQELLAVIAKGLDQPNAFSAEMEAMEVHRAELHIRLAEAARKAGLPPKAEPEPGAPVARPAPGAPMAGAQAMPRAPMPGGPSGPPAAPGMMGPGLIGQPGMMGDRCPVCGRPMPPGALPREGVPGDPRMPAGPAPMPPSAAPMSPRPAPGAPLPAPRQDTPHRPVLAPEMAPPEHAPYRPVLAPEMAPPFILAFHESPADLLLVAGAVGPAPGASAAPAAPTAPTAPRAAPSAPAASTTPTPPAAATPTAAARPALSDSMRVIGLFWAAADPEIRGQAGLSADQEKTVAAVVVRIEKMRQQLLDEVKARVEKESPSLPAAERERAIDKAQTAALIAAHPQHVPVMKEALDALTADQLKKIQQANEVRTNLKVSSGAVWVVSTARAKRALGLSDDVAAKVRKLIEDNADAAAAARKNEIDSLKDVPADQRDALTAKKRTELIATLEANRKKVKDAVMALLTDDQKVKIEKMMADPAWTGMPAGPAAPAAPK